ncbi:MAG: NAD-binding protein [Chloroflexi bacterium]|nr:NAD-binding protein [Chloroflexota bacterium]
METLASYAGHVVLCGLDDLGIRTLEELHRLGEDVVVVARAPDPARAAKTRALGVSIVGGYYRDETTLRLAGIATAHALVIVEDDDVGNLHAALTAQEVNPRLRIVLRLFDQSLGQRLQPLFYDCSALSASALAAPAFVEAALHDDLEQRFTLADRRLAVRYCSPADPSVLLSLAQVAPDETVKLFPNGAGNLYLVDLGAAPAREQTQSAAPAGERLRPRLQPRDLLNGLRLLVSGADARLRYLLGALLVLALISSLVFYIFAELSVIDSLYFTITIITTTGFGDINLRDAAAPLKLFGMFLMLVGASTLAILYALITDAIVGARLEQSLGGVHHRLQDHVIVCGVGNIGFRIVEQIAFTGLAVVAIELHERNRFVSTVRRLGIPVLVADARLPETLEAAQIQTARCVIVATNDDVANLETALNVRALNPELRVVVRFFDPDFAARVERALNVGVSRSTSELAAAAFAAAVVGHRVVTMVPVGNRVLVVAEVHVGPGAPAEGLTIRDLEAAAEGRVFVVAQSSRQTWHPAGDFVITAGQELGVIATRGGFAQLRDLVDTHVRP